MSDSREMRNPPFFDYVGYVKMCGLPFDLDVQCLLDTTRAIYEEIESREATNEPEFRYKIGTVVQNLEALLSAIELWKVTENNNYLNGIVMQFNSTGNLLNTIISEGDFSAEFVPPMRQRPLPEIADPTQFLYDLLDVRSQLRK